MSRSDDKRRNIRQVDMDQKNSDPVSDALKNIRIETAGTSGRKNTKTSQGSSRRSSASLENKLRKSGSSVNPGSSRSGSADPRKKSGKPADRSANRTDRSAGGSGRSANRPDRPERSYMDKGNSYSSASTNRRSSGGREYSYSGASRPQKASVRPGESDRSYGSTGRAYGSSGSYSGSGQPSSGSVPAYSTYPGINGFSQDVIPQASNELTRNGEINSTRKVRSRARKVERSGKYGSKEKLKNSQVSVYDPDSVIGLYPDSSVYGGGVVASGKVNPNTARISRETINRLLQESEAASAEKARAAEKIRHTSAGHIGTNRRSFGYADSYAERSHLHLGRIDNSKKSLKARQKMVKKGPGGKIAVLVIFIIVILVCVFGYIFARDIFDDAAMDPENLSKIEYTVTEGTTDEAVADFLVSNGMVESELIYMIRAKIFDADYVPGKYELSPSYSTEKIINILSGFDYSSGG